MREKVLEIVLSTLIEIARINNLQLINGIKEETSIIGEKGILDSLAFVTFLVALEQKINKEFNKTISLVSEKAFSQTQNSFRSPTALTEYIVCNW